MQTHRDKDPLQRGTQEAKKSPIFPLMFKQQYVWVSTVKMLNGVCLPFSPPLTGHILVGMMSCLQGKHLTMNSKSI